MVILIKMLKSKVYKKSLYLNVLKKSKKIEFLSDLVLFLFLLNLLRKIFFKK